MNVAPTALPGVVIVDPRVFEDRRGFFFESYHAERYARAGLPERFVQENHSRSIPGTLRGLHYQLRRLLPREPPGPPRPPSCPTRPAPSRRSPWPTFRSTEVATDERWVCTPLRDGHRGRGFHWGELRALALGA